jgi:diketogulonate reductase-like aldo/keto reductase
MEELVAEGLVRSIGSCNIGMRILKEIETYARLPPSVLQVEMHPYFPQEDLLAYCKKMKIAVTAYSSFGGAGYRAFGKIYGITDEDLIWKEEVIIGIGKKYEKSPQ